jgi:hypothetical protein
MPDVKISALTGASTPLASTEVLPIVQSGSTVQVSVANLTAGRAVSASSLANGLGAVGTPSYTFTGDTDTGMWSPAADTLAFSEGGTEVMRITSAGNIGIGTTSPTVPLEVSGSIRAVGLLQRVDNSGLTLVGGTTFNTTGASLTLRGSSSAFNVHGMEFYAGGSERMRILTGGNVGIGTGSPAEKLTVNSASSEFAIQWSGPGNDWVLGSTASRAYIRNKTAGVETLSISNAGNVGIGTSSPTTKLQVSAASGYNEIRVSSGANNLGLSIDAGAAYLATFQSTPLTFQTNSAERMRIASGGDVGIGTNAPSYKLQVNASSAGNQVAYFVNDSVGSTLGGISASINGGGNNTNSFHFVGVTQTVALWYLYGNGTTSYTSDIRVKKNVTTTRDGYLEDVCNLRVVKYNWYNDSDDTPRELGFIAQEVEQVFPGLVQDAMHPTKDGEIHKVLKGSVLMPIMVKALQEANAKIDALTARVAQLEEN